MTGGERWTDAATEALDQLCEAAADVSQGIWGALANGNDGEFSPPRPDAGGNPASPDPDDEPEILGRVTFGENANQKAHFQWHLQEHNIPVRDARNAIFEDIRLNSRSIPQQGPFRRTVDVNGQSVEYSGYRHWNGDINVGRATVK